MKQFNGWREIVIAASYTANWPALHHTGMTHLGHTWSLSVEEQFYVVWPATLCLILRLQCPRQRAIVAVVSGIFACAVWRALYYRVHHTPGPAQALHVLRLYMGLDTRGDALLVGCVVGLLAAWGMLPRSRRFVVWTGIGSVVAVAVLACKAWCSSLDHAQYYYGVFTVVALLVAAVILRMVSGPPPIGSLLLESRPLVGLGKISYAAYLYHIGFIEWFRPEGTGPAHPGTWLALTATLAAATVSYYCVERPCLRLKDRFGIPPATRRTLSVGPREDSEQVMQTAA